jgi:hypothetical protein
MADVTRELTRDETHWRVHEADASQCPGARGERCLIFDGDGVVRRAWAYPADWAELDDDTLWSLMQAAPPKTVDLPPPATPSFESTDPPAVAASVAACIHARSLRVVISLILSANRTLRDERAALLQECRRVRHAMRLTIEAYAQTLRTSGVPPERALVLIKAAVQQGIGAANATDEPVAEELVGDGVSWGIAAYYAA